MSLPSRPVSRTEHPESRPGSANASRKMLEVENDEAFVVGGVAADADALTAVRGSSAIVDTHVDLAIGSVDQARAVRSSRIDIVDKA